MKNKNIQTKLIILVFGLFFFSACTITNPTTWPVIGKYLGGSDESVSKQEEETSSQNVNINTGEPVTLTYWGLYMPKEIIEPLITKYQDQNPSVTIVYEEQKPTSVAEYKEKVATRITSGGGPDIFRAHNTWFGYMNNLMSPIPTTVMTEEDYANRFYAIAKQSSSISGQIYGIPLEYDQLVLIYNKDFFSEAGVVNPPETWEEFRLDAIKLTKRDGTGAITQAGAAVGVIDNIHYATDILGYMFSQSDVTIPTFLDDPASQSVVNYYKGLAASDEVWDLSLPQSPVAFANGKVAMIFGTTQTIRDILSINPAVNLGVANAPQVPSLEGTDNLTDTYWANFYMESVSSNSQNPLIAWDFLRFLSEEENQRELRNGFKLYQAAVPAFGNKILNSSVSEEFIVPVIKGAEKASSGLIAGCAGNLAYQDAVANVVRGTSNLDTAKTEIETLLSSSNIGVSGTQDNCPYILGAASTGNTPPPIVPSENKISGVPVCTNLVATVNSLDSKTYNFVATVTNSSNALSYGVVFGDGKSGTTSGLVFDHSYDTDGTYNIKFTPVATNGEPVPCETTVTVVSSNEVEKPTVETTETTTVTGNDIKTGVSSYIAYILSVGLLIIGFSLIKGDKTKQ